MDIVNDKNLELKRLELLEYFKEYSKNIFSNYKCVKENVVKWSYSLGITNYFTPLENLIPSVYPNKGKEIVIPTKANLKSKNLICSGYNKQNELCLEIKRYDQDIHKYGENVRYLDYVGGNKVIVNAHIYESNVEKSRLNSLCYIINEDNESVYYISITPPNNWFVRVDKLVEDKITDVSMFATSWFKQINYEIYYDNNFCLSKIMIGEYVHWESKK